MSGIFDLPEGNEAGLGHTIIFGSTGYGRGVDGDAEASRGMLPVFVLGSRTNAPASSTDTPLPAVSARQAATCAAYWQATPEDSGDFANIADALQDVLDISPTRDQVRLALGLLPEELFGQGIAWGFNDSVVRDDIYEFFEKHRGAVRSALMPAS